MVMKQHFFLIENVFAFLLQILIFIFQMFERETRREKILEARNKELRLKEKTKGILGLGGAVLVILKLLP
jgi:hypothetical protein